MTAPRGLEQHLVAWRIGDPAGRYPIYSPEGARRSEGRWHTRGQEVIYASEHYSTAMLEKLVHYNGVLPPNQHFIQIQIPLGTSYEVVTKDSLPGWHQQDAKESRPFGSRWIDECRSAVLIVPSVVAREEHNLLINPEHEDSDQIAPGREQPVWWDQRLFS